MFMTSLEVEAQKKGLSGEERYIEGLVGGTLRKLEVKD